MKTGKKKQKRDVILSFSDWCCSLTKSPSGTEIKKEKKNG